MAEAPGAAGHRVASGRRGELALALQEAFTVAVRLRTRRQVAANAQAFRAHVKQLLQSADRQARAAGYDPAQVRLAIYAYVAFLDESVLNSGQSMFAEWGRQPLQEEVFGDHVAGETFFRQLSELLNRQDSEELADLLEVYLLCLLLGFGGKHAADPGTLQAMQGAVQEKIRRVRGGPPPFAPQWSLPEGEQVTADRDPWVPRLGVAAIATLVLALALWVILHFALGADLSELDAVAARLAP